MSADAFSPVPASTGDGPRRIQLRRTKGWRKPKGAVVVTRATRWGNPAAIGTWVSAGEDWQSTTRQGSSTVVGNRRDAVVFYRLGLRYGGLVIRDHLGVMLPWRLPSHDEIRAELVGRDLCCWCPLDEPCHADTLLTIANATLPAGTAVHPDGESDV